jgi:hypothetical protein
LGRPRRRRCDLCEDLRQFTLEGGKLHGGDRLARVEHEIDMGLSEAGRKQNRNVKPSGLAHAPLDAVAVDGLAHDATDGKADARAFYGGLLAGQADAEKVAHGWGVELATGLVDPLVVSVAAQAKGRERLFAGTYGAAE